MRWPWRVACFVEPSKIDTAATASIEDVAVYATRVDAQVKVVLAQHRSVETAFRY